MKGLLEAGTAVASSCGGEGVCAKCVVRVNKGQENLSKPQELENDLSEIHGFMKIERVSCQVSVLGDIEIDTDYW